MCVCVFRMLAEKLDLKKEESLPKIVDLIRTTRVDAKIDSERNQLVMDKPYPTVYALVLQHALGVCVDLFCCVCICSYQQVIDKTKGLAYRSTQLAVHVGAKYE